MHPLTIPVAVLMFCVLLLTINGLVVAFYLPSVRETKVELKDGREIVCVIPGGFFSRSISCDWDAK